jgi:hypothetical protein
MHASVGVERFTVFVAGGGGRPARSCGKRKRYEEIGKSRQVCKHTTYRVHPVVAPWVGCEGGGVSGGRAKGASEKRVERQHETLSNQIRQWHE